MSRQTATFHHNLAQIEELCLQNAGTLDLLETAIISEVGNYIASNGNILPNLNKAFQESHLRVSSEITEKVYQRILNDLRAEIAYITMNEEHSLSNR